VSSRDDREKLIALAETVGRDWTEGPYYDEAELAMEEQWLGEIWPLIREVDFECTVELAAGHGRNSEKLRHLARHLYLVDINIENIDFLRRRFADATNITFVHNNGIDIGDVPSEAATFVYSFDAMVHFDSDVVRAYLREFHRVLRVGGHGFAHYSNYTENPTGSYKDHPGWRNFMSRELFEHYAAKEGLTPIVSKLRNGDADAMTLFRREA
jgi:ubiquinone/menaquinone biosynthesis C-methylase UbiE